MSTPGSGRRRRAVKRATKQVLALFRIRRLLELGVIDAEEAAARINRVRMGATK